MYIVKNSKKQVIQTGTVTPGDKILAGSYLDNQRKLQMATGEEIRIHADNGGYLFSVRNKPTGPVIFYEKRFSQQATEYETPIEMFPWLKGTNQNA